MADRRPRSVILLAVIVCAMGLVVVFNPILVFGNGLEWGVPIGTTLDFVVLCRLHVDNESDWTIDPAIQRALSLNGTTVISNVSSLPAVRYVSRADGFAASVIECIKVSAQFPDGTLSSVIDAVTLLISRSLLPVGNWDFINALYPDSSYQMSLGEYHWEYLSWAGESTFSVSHIGREHHGSKGWAANVTMATGCPISITWFDYRVHDYPPYAGYSVSLTLTSTDT